MVKEPRAGRVKTRLGASIGMGRAASLFRNMTAHTIREAQKSGFSLRLAVDPPSSVSACSAIWPSNIIRTPQGRGNLGERMTRVLHASPPGPAVVIGADAPGLRARYIRTAFEKLKGADAVFGPAHDGGFWLIGLARRRAAPNLFENVRWSSESTLEDTRAGLPKAFSIAEINVLSDVDTSEDLALIRPYSTGS